MSAIYDKNLERARAVERDLAAGKISQAAAEKRLSELRAVPDYWVKVYDGHQMIRRHVAPPESIRAAEKLEKQLQGEITTGIFVPEHLIKTRVGEILDAYLKKQEGRGGYASVKSRMRLTAPIRHQRLEAWHNNVKLIENHLDEDTPEAWADKTIWNYATMLQYAVQAFIDANQRINIKNPVRTAIKVMGLSGDYNRRLIAPSDLEADMLLAGARKKTYPRYFAPLLSLLHETGLREVEVLGMRWEQVSMEYVPKKVKPWADVDLRKKKKKVRRRIPLSPAAYQALQVLQELAKGHTETGWVFPVRSFPGRLFRRLRAELGLEHLIPHDFRRKWRLDHLEDGQELRKEVGGHDTNEMDEAYLVLSLEQTERIYDEEWETFERESYAG